MKERLDRFCLIELLLQSFHYNQDGRVLKLGYDLAEMPAGWWLHPHGSPCMNKAFMIFKDLIGFVVSAYQRHLFRSKITILGYLLNQPGSYGIEDIGASVLVAHQAAYHIAQYVGNNWTSHIKQAYSKGKIHVAWLHDLLPTRSGPARGSFCDMHLGS